MELVRDALGSDGDNPPRPASNRSDRGFVDVEIEAHRQPDPAQHSKGIVVEVARVNHAHHSAPDVFRTLERIASFAGGEIHCDRIDREITAAEVGPAREVVDAIVDDHAVHGEVAAPQRDHFAEGGCAGERVIAFHVDIERFDVEQEIADGAADCHRALWQKYQLGELRQERVTQHGCAACRCLRSPPRPCRRR